MGSSKYPDENEYDSFISKSGGGSNAFTECEYTLYHFDVLPQHLEKVPHLLQLHRARLVPLPLLYMPPELRFSADAVLYQPTPLGALPEDKIVEGYLR